MKLRELLLSTKVETVRGALDSEITAITYDSRSIQAPGAIFVAISGENVDGAVFINSATKNGASAIVHEGILKLDVPPHAKTTYVKVANARRALADLSARFYDHPSRNLKLIGITGTNGKTTTSYLIKQICDHAGLACGLIGTVNYQFGNGESIPSVRTTPESTDIQRLLARVVNVGSKAVAMEVSSHAIATHRIDGLEFNSAVFTNLTQDHLDFHRGMSNYFELCLGR